MSAQKSTTSITEDFYYLNIAHKVHRTNTYNNNVERSVVPDFADV